MSRASERSARAEHANQLIRVIADHGRRFFWNEGRQRYASIEVDERGKVWFVDDYSGRRIYTHKTTFGNGWMGFSHGGTLRSLVEKMRDYIMAGEQIHLDRIAPTMIDGKTNLWGYERLAAYETRIKAMDLPIIKTSGDFK